MSRKTKLIDVASKNEMSPVEKVKMMNTDDAVKINDIVTRENPLVISDLSAVITLHCEYDDKDSVDPHNLYIYVDGNGNRYQSSSELLAISAHEIADALETIANEQIWGKSVSIIAKDSGDKNKADFYRMVLN